MTEYADKELRRYEAELRDLKDRYNTNDKQIDKSNYKKIVNADIALAPSSEESLKQYVERIRIYQKIASDKNWNTHVDNPYKTWHVHKNPMGCFICQDSQFISVLVQVLEYLDRTIPDQQFKQTESD